MCAAIAHSSGEIKDPVILKDNRLLTSLGSASFEALDKNVLVLFLIVLLIWHGCCLYKILACLNYF